MLFLIKNMSANDNSSVLTQSPFRLDIICMIESGSISYVKYGALVNQHVIG